MLPALAASCPLASYSAGSPSKEVPAPETHPSPIAYSYSYIVVAYSESWSSYCSRASFHSCSLRPQRSSGLNSSDQKEMASPFLMRKRFIPVLHTQSKAARTRNRGLTCPDLGRGSDDPWSNLVKRLGASGLSEDGFNKLFL
ncbi:hypothetical protein V6N12_028972 [Hibiscus sabdariffa]|uniref:Uncharacterized protein n=1 Tax=Hibiscus sabdariffa TaxID=183260 RepID=A0ABR2F7D5_9ROSI